MTEIFAVYDDRFIDIVSPEAVLETVVDGFKFVEGAIWHPGRKEIIFSDIIGNTMYRWKKTDGLSIFRKPSNMANGNTLDRQGRLLTCEHATSRVTRTEADGEITILASHYEGKELNSPNDIVTKRDGSIFFTDPASGRTEKFGVLREQELDFQGVYRLDDQGMLTLLVDDFSKPNGLCFSLDEKYLFINDTDHGHIRVFNVNHDGTLGNGKIWAELNKDGIGVADGMKIDQAGNLYCCGPGGIHVFDQVGVYLGIIKIPEQAANFNWGDQDLSSLYICASTTLYRLRMNIPGFILWNEGQT
jgi:gluconolactonase